MKKYNLKKYVLPFIFTVALITVQFFFTTEIPKLLAKNINIGIMQQGVEKIVFDKMDDKTYGMLMATTNYKDLISSSYTKDGDVYELNKSADINKVEEATSDTLGKLMHTDNKMAKIQMIASVNKKLNNNKGLHYIFKSSAIMLLFALIGAISVVLSGYIISYQTADFAKKLRSMIFKKVENFSTYNLEKFGIASLLTRTTNDINNLQNSINMILKISIGAPIAVVISAIQAYLIAPELMKVIVILSAILMIVILLAIFLLTTKIAFLQKLTDRMNNILREILTGKRVIRSFNKESVEDTKFDAVNKDLKSTSWFINVVTSIVNPFAGFMINISAVIIIYYVAKIIPTTNIGVGNIFAFIQYAVLIMVYFLLLTAILFVIPVATVSFKRIDAVLSEKVDIFNDDSLEDIKSIDTLEFQNVNFNYEGSEDKVISNLSFNLKRGETLGIIGGTGSGKSTIPKLILRFLDATDGKILLNGKEIKSLRLTSLRDKIAYTPQTSKVFSGTVLDNVAYNAKVKDENLAKKAIELACASEFADLNRVIEQAGANLSGGQKQRIQIARSIYKNADILIFDDSFSALDNTTDKKIRENIQEMNNMKIIVSQKISTIQKADKILVLNEGLVIGIGTHEELLENCSIYAEINSTQKGGAID